MKKAKKHNDNLLIVLVVLLAIISTVLIIVLVINSKYLEPNSELVTELHNYFSSEDLGNCEGLINYDSSKVEYKDLDNEVKLCLAYQKSTITNIEKETLKADKKKEICTMEKGKVFKTNDDSKECTISKIKKEIIDNSYEKIFGKNIENNEVFKIDNLNICYLKDDYYYCGLSETFTYTLGNESIIYRVIKKAEEKSSEIIIYDYFLKLTDNTCYMYYTTNAVNQKCTNSYKEQKEINYKFMKKHGTLYKHIYKKADDGTYYWVSSEPTKN